MTFVNTNKIYFGLSYSRIGCGAEAMQVKGNSVDFWSVATETNRYAITIRSGCAWRGNPPTNEKVTVYVNHRKVLEKPANVCGLKQFSIIAYLCRGDRIDIVLSAENVTEIDPCLRSKVWDGAQYGIEPIIAWVKSPNWWDVKIFNVKFDGEKLTFDCSNRLREEKPIYLFYLAGGEREYKPTTSFVYVKPGIHQYSFKQAGIRHGRNNELITYYKLKDFVDKFKVIGLGVAPIHGTPTGFYRGEEIDVNKHVCSSSWYF